MDIFAQIAASGVGGRDELLTEPQPMKFVKKICVPDGAEKPAPIMPKMQTEEELREALTQMRGQYEPFLRDLAPKTQNYRRKIELKEFLLDGKPISLPTYGAPLGDRKQTYETTYFAEVSKEEAAYICFSGVDYYAVVTVNGICVGTHEGFFSPFEFEITKVLNQGENTLRVEVYNDYTYLGNAFATQVKCEGDKLYAATGIGWDDPAEGWHHCPAGMGIYHDVTVEIRRRVNITDLYVRPMAESAEIWVEIENADYEDKDIVISLSVYGQNFSETVIENMQFSPSTTKTVGRGDSLTEATEKDRIGKETPLPLKHGKNIYKLPFSMKAAKVWSLETPFLYQAQVAVSVDGECSDIRTVQFGMRTFEQDLQNSPKGMFFLNGRKIRLRGANTMGFEQQDVIRGDRQQLIDDILLAKICHMNFLRLTQRPVQDEIYAICDRLGMMTQTDLPLFGCMRRTKLCEGVRQAEEMERLVRKHPCNVLISYINEPFPNANNEPHRHLNREELEQFFTMCDIAVRLQNPDRVIKHVDGDYDPPTEGMPDNHCYPMWYNGHGIDIGKLHKGYWMVVKPDWYYGCGEYGAEGLDSVRVIRNDYPAAWLKEPFSPRRIVRSQTEDFHYFFYDTPNSLEEWVEKSQAYQAFATRMMTEAFRRDDRMISHAIHLFIDAWPSGWMKAIMDHRRIPKKAYFAYRDALEPMMVSLRTDRFSYFSGEQIDVECYVCNDTEKEGNYFLSISYNLDGAFCGGCEIPVSVKSCGTVYAANIQPPPFAVSERKEVCIRAVLTDVDKKPLAGNEITLSVFPDVSIAENDKVVLVQNLAPGEYQIAGETVLVKPCGMLSTHFVSRKTGHPAVRQFAPKDFSYWYDKKEDRITPLLDTTFSAKGFTPILTGGNLDENGNWSPALACAVKEFEGKRYIICQVDLRTENPVAKHFLHNLMKSDW